MKYEIILGDCELKLKEILDSSIHLTWTSPPYYNAKSYSQWPTYDEYLIFLEKVFLGEIVKKPEKWFEEDIRWSD